MSNKYLMQKRAHIYISMSDTAGEYIWKSLRKLKDTLRVKKSDSPPASRNIGAHKISALYGQLPEHVGKV
jgi:hypothetical protein